LLEPQATDAVPGSAEKIDILAKRWASGQKLHAEGDTKFEHAPTVDISGAAYDLRRTHVGLVHRQHSDQRVSLFEQETYRVAVGQARRKQQRESVSRRNRAVCSQ
jgi:hypothetical protein